jgi:photoactive yellow protein
MSQTLQKLRTLVNQPGTEPEASASSNNPEIASLEEQLVFFYQELEYLQQNFPNQTVRSLVDYAKSLQQRLESGSGAQGDLGFVPADIVRRLGNLDQAAADECDFGIVEVDDNGLIRLYNRWEQQLAGISLQQAQGRNFFIDVAPCTNNRLFLGRFRQGVQTGSLDVGFNYTFTYKIRPTSVSIHMYRHAASQRNYVFVKRR